MKGHSASLSLPRNLFHSLSLRTITGTLRSRHSEQKCPVCNDRFRGVLVLMQDPEHPEDVYPFKCDVSFCPQCGSSIKDGRI
jgi:uncharacterized protein with PIN domain